MLNLTSAQLRKAADLQDRIGALNKELAALIGNGDVAATATVAPVRARKRGMSAAGRAAVAAAQKARWAKIHAAAAKGKAKAAAPAAAVKPARKKFKMSAAGRARIIAAQKARWAKVKAAKQ